MNETAKKEEEEEEDFFLTFQMETLFESNQHEYIIYKIYIYLYRVILILL